MRRTINSEALELLKKGQTLPPVLITKENLNGLPEPVQRYLRYAQIVSKETIRTVYLKQQGWLRMQPNQKWQPLVAEQYYTTHPPAFLWYGTIQPFPFFAIAGKDSFCDGQGNLLIKLFSWITLVDAKSPEVDHSELLRYLGEMVWFPTAWLSDLIEWEAINTQSARATIRYQGITASALLYFNEKDQLTYLTAQRYREERGRSVLDQWTVQVKNYQQINSFWIPIEAEAIWNLASGDFSYFRGEITQIEYNDIAIELPAKELI